MKKVIQNIFSIRNEYRNGVKYKIIIVLGITIKIKKKKKLKQRINEVNQRIEQVNQRFDQVHQRFDQVHQRFDHLYQKFDEINMRMIGIPTVVQKSIAIANLHQKTFLEYKNIHEGQRIIICGAGTTLKFFEPLDEEKDGIKNVYIALNRAFLYDKIKFDYIFTQDYRSIEHIKTELIEYKGNNCTKFIGMQNGCINTEIPATLAIKCNGKKFGTDVCNFDMGIYRHSFADDISSMPLGNFTSIVFPAMQFALYTNPKEIYLAGVDCSLTGHFDNFESGRSSEEISEENYKNMRRDWDSFKEFKNLYYPETKIVSINPVGLKGLFDEDIYTVKNNFI